MFHYKFLKPHLSTNACESVPPIIALLIDARKIKQRARQHVCDAVRPPRKDKRTHLVFPPFHPASAIRTFSPIVSAKSPPRERKRANFEQPQGSVRLPGVQKGFERYQAAEEKREDTRERLMYVVAVLCKYGNNTDGVRMAKGSNGGN